jgi:UDP-glucose:(heptosyl)LPS alpha-1,3-glucosyltransferase
MNLAVVRRRLDPVGGGEHYAANLIQALIARGHEVTAVTEVAPEGGPPAGADLAALGPGSGAAHKRLLGFARRLADWRAGSDHDLVLSLERVPGGDVWRSGEGLHRAWLERRRTQESRLKTLTFGLNPLHRAHLRLERDLMADPGLKRIVANSELVARDLVRLYGVDQTRITVVPTGVDPARVRVGDPAAAAAEVRAELGLDQRPVLLFVGSGFKRKGLAWALEALAVMNRGEAVLVVAGRDRLEKFERLAARLGVADRVRLLGHRTDVGRLLAAADEFVLPTLYDPQSGACLEALAAGVPVVTTPFNGAADFIVNGVGGMIVPHPEARAQLARAMDYTLRITNVAVAIPTFDEHVDRLVEVLGEVSRARA